jgi:membrane-bound lytic murein transglycosylase D
LQLGQRLVVSGTAAAAQAAAPAGESLRYTVRRGDTLSLIARRYAVTVRQLQAWNNMGGRTMLQAGQRLTIHLDGRRNLGG